MPRLIGRNLRFVLQRQPNIVQPIQQAMTREFIHRERGAKALIVAHFALFQINGELVIVDLLGLAA